MRVITDVEDLRVALHSLRPVALVPTMGNLHAGHLALVRTARQHAPTVVASIFVNPLQFGPNEDYARYPRTLAQDCEQLADAGVDVVFTPVADALYPNGLTQHTQVIAPGLSEILCGRFRPDLFPGAATVVTMLFHAVQPSVAVFGEKDWQQLAIIRKITQDLLLPVRIVGHPTEREADGLAMSSRNQYLTPEQRAQAPTLYRILQTLRHEIEQGGQRDYPALCARAVEELAHAGFRVDYVEIREADSLALVQTQHRHLRLLAAAWLGAARLIDNLGIELI